jgi:hypothetical protein
MTDDAPKQHAATRDIPDGFIEEVCAWIAMGKSLKSYLDMFGDAYEPRVTMFIVYAWLRRDDNFAECYARAREDRADSHADEMTDIADNATNDVYIKIGKDGRPFAAIDGDAINRARLRIDTRKWIAAKLRPNYYGDKIDVTTGGQQIGKMSGPGGERIAIMQELIDRAAARIGIVPKVTMKPAKLVDVGPVKRKELPAPKVDPFS